MKTTETILLDVREDIRNGREPFSKILSAAAALRADQKLLLLAPFEPIPIVHTLARQGFRHTSVAKPTGDWEVLFVRDCSAEQGASEAERLTGSSGGLATRVAEEVLDLDARGLEPPLPMIKILEAVATLPTRAKLRARTDRRPLHLYSQLEERGFAAQTEEQTDGSYITCIYGR